LLTFSAAVYFVAAIPLIFAPAELCRYFDAGAGEGYNVLLQALGSALLGFAMLNWSNRFSRLGGVFGRPIIMANLGHTATAFLLLVRAAVEEPGYLPLAVPTVAYLVLAVGFGSRLFTAPTQNP
jgi:hypothetical protein